MDAILLWIIMTLWWGTLLVMLIQFRVHQHYAKNLGWEWAGAWFASSHGKLEKTFLGVQFNWDKEHLERLIKIGIIATGMCVAGALGLYTATPKEILMDPKAGAVVNGCLSVVLLVQFLVALLWGYKKLIEVSYKKSFEASFVWQTMAKRLARETRDKKMLQVIEALGIAPQRVHKKLVYTLLDTGAVAKKGAATESKEDWRMRMTQISNQLFDQLYGKASKASKLES